MSHGPEPLAHAYAACEALARSHYENFPVASRLLPAMLRPHVAAVYAFARVADDIADEGTTPAADRRARLGAWLHRLHAAAGILPNGVQSNAAGPSRFSDGPANDAPPASAPHADDSPDAAVAGAREESIIVALAHSIRSLDLPISLFDDLVSAFGQDTMTCRYRSWAEVLDYCRRSANPVGRLVLRIAGYRDARLDRSSDALCTALQLTNFWQDFGRDWRAGRLYVPRDVLEECAADEAHLAGGAMTAAWACALERCFAVTRGLFAEGRGVCDGVRGRLGAELRFTWLGGMRVLERVERARSVLLERRPSLGPADVPLLLWRALRWTQTLA